MTNQTLATAEGLAAHAESIRVLTGTADVKAESESTNERGGDADTDDNEPKNTIDHGVTTTESSE